MENPSPRQVPSARECQTMSNTLCDTRCQMAMAFLAQHPSWAALLVRPCTHGLIQAADPAWGELFCHIGIPCLYDLSDLPEAIPEGWWLPCCNCKGLQDRFKPFPRHE